MKDSKLPTSAERRSKECCAPLAGSAILLFHEWKARQVDADSQHNGVFRYYRELEWYYAAYGQYCSSHADRRTVIQRVVRRPTVTRDYEPYGDEWRREVMKLTKAQIVEILRTECMARRQPPNK